MFASITFAYLLAFPPAPIALRSHGAQQPLEVNAAARKEITAAYAVWGKARTSFDIATFDKMLAPDFVALLPQGKATRKEFIEMVSVRSPQIKLTRFESQIISLTKKDDSWIAVITEKLEAEGKTADGKAVKLYSVWVTRDGWKKVGGHWVVGFTEAIGTESWRDTVPPIPGW